MLPVASTGVLGREHPSPPAQLPRAAPGVPPATVRTVQPFLPCCPSAKPSHGPQSVTLLHFPPGDRHHVTCTKLPCLQALSHASPLPRISYSLFSTHSFNVPCASGAPTLCQAPCHRLGISEGTNKTEPCPQPD